MDSRLERIIQNRGAAVAFTERHGKGTMLRATRNDEGKIVVEFLQSGSDQQKGMAIFNEVEPPVTLSVAEVIDQFDVRWHSLA